MIRKGMVLSFLISVFFISGCQSNIDIPIDSGVKCVIGGCSSQVCTTEERAKGLVTTCEYREEYSCLKLSNCGFFDGKCGWEETPEYLQCLDGVRG